MPASADDSERTPDGRRPGWPGEGARPPDRPEREGDRVFFMRRILAQL
ncbi:hypothetical protein RC1_0690 [Rhodospirillum centenum SW]|uniref:Uncharacterized protein n=1 Tax=Rhodospirillum centenum (strain ATCC 51521 / SW) TaxID=414684 RepID=B6IRN8_RHOCS|nr:hypothetical protein RC1_0690 [Rhodospirillum centenum SW]